MGSRTRKYPAKIHRNARVSYDTSEASNVKGFVPVVARDETMFLVLLMAECISTVRSRLPLVRQ